MNTNGTARETALYLDLLDAEPITRLFEDEADPADLNALDLWAAEDDYDSDMFVLVAIVVVGF